MGYEFKTAFWTDFTIADAFGIDAIKNTYKRAFKEWKDNYVYLTELVLVLNWKCWAYYEKGNKAYSSLYCDLYEQARDYGYNTLKGKQLDYFWSTLD